MPWLFGSKSNRNSRQIRTVGSRIPRGYRLRGEVLESRQLRAVVAAVSGTTLNINCDDGNDNFALIGDPTTATITITITGKNDSQGNPTLVNGTPNGTLSFSPVSAGINIQLGFGENTVTLDNVYVAGDITIVASDDNGLHNPLASTVTLGGTKPVYTGGRFDIALQGSGANVIHADNSNVLAIGDVDWQTGSSNGYVTATGVQTQSLFILSNQSLPSGVFSTSLNSIYARNSLYVQSPLGTNNIAVQNSYSAGANIYLVGDGVRQNTLYLSQDTFTSVLTVNCSNLNFTTLSQNSAGGIFVNTQFQTTNSINPNLDLFNNHVTGSGDPSLSALSLVTGNTQDNVFVASNLIDTKASVLLGSGDDDLNFSSNTVKGVTTLDGQAGTNQLTLANNSLSTLNKSNFS